MKKTIRWSVIWLIVGILSLGLSACAVIEYSRPDPTPRGLIQVALELRDFYESLGGESELGAAISAAFTRDGVLCQYTTNVLMCHNPSAQSEAERNFLAPIGQQLNLSGPAEASSAPQVYEGFADFYHQKFFGMRYVGRPLTGVRFNSEKNRLEQYFEKMGFYVSLNTSSPSIHLLAYGLYTCGERCAPGGVLDSAIIGWDKGTESLNPEALERLGGYRVFGRPLTRPYRGEDGNLEQVLEKVVIYVPRENPSTLKLRSLGVTLNLMYSDPAPQHYTALENMTFYPVKGNLGYHVPVVFDQFIANHGGPEISGQPLTDPYPVNNGTQAVAGQCFGHYCLEYYSDTTNPEQQVQLVSLGRAYLEKQKQAVPLVFTFARDTVDLLVSEAKPQISNGEAQVIQIALHTRKDHRPVADVESFVMLAMPDGKKSTYALPPTDKNGMAQATLTPLSAIENGVIIPYIVCLNVPSEEQICASDSFLVWSAR